MDSTLLLLDSNQLLETVFAFALPFFRIAAFFSVLPLIGSRMVPARVRIILSLVVTMGVFPMLQVNVEPNISLSIILLVLTQILIGVAMAFLFVIFFHIFALAGQLLALQMGLGFASMIDPSNGVSVPIVSQFYTILVGLLFMAFDGHLLAIEGIVQSFNVMPIVLAWEYEKTAFVIFSAGSWLFASACLMALPAVIAVLIVNIAFGVMTRSAPQLNIFSLGFPFTLIFGVFIFWVSIQGILDQYSILSLSLFERLAGLLVF